MEQLSRRQEITSHVIRTELLLGQHAYVAQYFLTMYSTLMKYSHSSAFVQRTVAVHEPPV